VNGLFLVLHTGTEVQRLQTSISRRKALLAHLFSCTAAARPSGNLTPHNVRRYLTYMKTTVSSKGQIVLPAEFRQMDEIEPGQEFEVERLGRGEYRLVRREPPKNEGVVDWLLACPHKGFFTPVDSESTDSL
jgi:AbrB family looped-hinge helix DNA binding protein